MCYDLNTQTKWLFSDELESSSTVAGL